jgi:hypothetical protein
MFQRLHVAYTDMFCNPFYNPGENITSRLEYDEVYAGYMNTLARLETNSSLARVSTIEICTNSSIHF